MTINYKPTPGYREPTDNFDDEVAMDNLGQTLKEQAIRDMYAIGEGRIIPHKHEYNNEDRDLEIAELLAKKMRVFGTNLIGTFVFDADEMQMLRKFIQRKRIGSMSNIERNKP